MNKKAKWLKGLVLLFVAAASAAGAAVYWGGAQDKASVKFITTPVKRGNLSWTILSTGNVQAVSMVSVGTQISGTIKAIYVDYNSVVKKGDLIAVIDPATQEANLVQAQAVLAAANADIMEAQANLNNARLNLGRTEQLVKKDLIAKADLDQDRTSLVTAKARLASAQALAAQRRAEVDKAKLQLGYTRIYSPVDGVIISKNVDEGQTVAASFNTPTLVEIAEDLSNMQVEVKIDEADVGNVFNGQKAKFTVDAFPEREFNGTVTQVRLSPAEDNSVVTYTAVVSFKNEQKKDGRNLMPGMTATVTLLVSEKEDVLIVPNSALRFRPVDSSSKKSAAGGGGMMGPTPQQSSSMGAEARPQVSAVYELKDGVPVKREVKRGITNGNQTELKSGAEEGLEVITGIEAPKDK